jgi:hypothetical protein
MESDMADRWVSAQEYDADMKERIRQTENEIARSVFGEEERDYDDSFLEGQSRVEGWEDTLSDAQLAHDNINGHDPNGFDQSIAMQEQAELLRENAQMKEHLKLLDGIVQQDFLEPQRQQQKAQVRERVRQQLMDQYGIYDSFDDAKLDKFIADNVDREQRLQAYEQQRVNRSFDDARARYGEKDFWAVYNRVSEMRASPTSMAMVQEIQNSENPGEALMSLHGSDMVEMLRGRSAPPFVNQGSRQPLQRKGSGGGHIGHDIAGGWGDSDVERDVMNSVWD